MLQGNVHPDFGRVAVALSRVLPRGTPGGGAVCVYHRGQKVVDVWGGTRDERGNPWEESTLAPSFSTAKGVVATLLHMQVDRGRLGYDDPVIKHWPEFEAEGKQGVTVRHLLCHEAGLYDVRSLIDDAHQMLDWEAMVRALEAAPLAHAPGAAHGYHALTYGWLVGELLRRVTGKSVPELVTSELAGPLALDGLYIGLPDAEHGRCARLTEPPVLPISEPAPQGTFRGNVERFFSYLAERVHFPVDPERIRRAMLPRGIRQFDWNAPEVLRACIPAANGAFTARSLARMYAALAQGGELDGVKLVSPDTLEQASRVQNRGLDRVIPVPMAWRLGYHRVFSRFRSPGAFGHFGLGGSGAFADPARQLALGFVVNYGTGTPFGDTRIVQVVSAAIHSVQTR